MKVCPVCDGSGTVLTVRYGKGYRKTVRVGRQCRCCGGEGFSNNNK